MRDINGSKPTSFPLDEEKLSFKIPCPDRPPREKILKLGSMITNRIGLKATVDDPEYWGLDALVTDEMADVALKMGVRKPKTIEQLMKLTKKKIFRLLAWVQLDRIFSTTVCGPGMVNGRLSIMIISGRIISCGTC